MEMPSFFLFGSPGRTRTADKVVNSHLLYQLSYRGIEPVYQTGWTETESTEDVFYQKLILGSTNISNNFSSAIRLDTHAHTFYFDGYDVCH